VYPLSNSILNHYYNLYYDWRIIPERNSQGHVPDYIVQTFDKVKIEFVDKIIVEVKRPGYNWLGETGIMKQVNLAASWCGAKTYAQEFFTICIVGLDIGFFESYDFELVNCYSNMVPLNPFNLSVEQLSNLGVGLESHNDNIVAHKWSLANSDHEEYIDYLFKYMKNKKPLARS
jgi:hypothetical protein